MSTDPKSPAPRETPTETRGPDDALPAFKVSVARCAELRATDKCAGVSCPECPAASPPPSPHGDAPDKEA